MNFYTSNPTPMLKSHEAEKKLNISAYMLKKLTDEGHIKAYSLGNSKRLMYKDEDIQNFIKEFVPQHDDEVVI